MAGSGAYSAAKFGVEGLTQVLAVELASFNIRVNALRPASPTATPALFQHANNALLKILKRVDIVRPLALFLATEDSAGITGESFFCEEWNPAHGFGDVSQYMYEPLQK